MPPALPMARLNVKNRNANDLASDDYPSHPPSALTLRYRF